MKAHESDLVELFSLCGISQDGRDKVMEVRYCCLDLDVPLLKSKRTKTHSSVAVLSGLNRFGFLKKDNIPNTIWLLYVLETAKAARV